MPSELDQLRRENARLIGLLEAHGIAWRASRPAPTEPAPISEAPPTNAPGSTQEKVALFRRLFRGRDDVYALRWHSSSSGRSGYGPACANEWRPGLCEKPRISCRDCNQRELQPLSDVAIYGHLAGEHTIGLSTPCCWHFPCRGGARCSNRPAACTGSKQGKPACASSTGSISATQCRNACGSDDCVALGRWDIH